MTTTTAMPTFYNTRDVFGPDSDNPEFTSFYLPTQPPSKMPKNCIMALGIYSMDEEWNCDFRHPVDMWFTDYGIAASIEVAKDDPRHGVVYLTLTDARFEPEHDAITFPKKKDPKNTRIALLGLQLAKASLWNDEKHIMRFVRQAIDNILSPWHEERMLGFALGGNICKDPDISLRAMYGRAFEGSSKIRAMHKEPHPKADEVHPDGIEGLLREGRLDPKDDNLLMGAFGALISERGQHDILATMKEQGLDHPDTVAWMQEHMGIHLDDYRPFKVRLQRILDSVERRNVA